MSKKKKKGLPRQLEEEEEAQTRAKEHPIEDFLQSMFGNDALAKNQDGLPPLDWLRTKFRTKSAAIRYLVNQGTPIKVIARHLGIKYQHARNVATQQLKRGPNEDWHPKPDAEETKETKAKAPEVEVEDEDGDDREEGLPETNR